MERAELTDGDWELIRTFLPVGRFGPYPERLRQQFEGVIWRFRTGSQWRDVPPLFGAWQTVYNRFAQWRDAGVFEGLLDAAITEAARRGQADLSLVSVDSTVVRAHHDAAGTRVRDEVLASLERAAGKTKRGRRRGRKAQAPAKTDQADVRQQERRRVRRRRRSRLKAARLGRSRGGLTSKVHLAADRRCRPLAFELTEGQAADSPRFIPVLDKVKVRGPVGRPRTRPGAVAGDMAYSSRANRTYLRKRKIKAVIPEKADQAANRKRKGHRGGRPVFHDAQLYRERNTVERCINKIKAWRGLATRYDKTPESYLAGLHLRGAVIWLRSLRPA
ncbi:IS5 family transposase [Streptomyces sioyaensis]|uniref:IS5 family transposase n=1 Tax=Streptomyces sioyaensis TaxID=67364 RepID=UPI0037BE05E5